LRDSLLIHSLSPQLSKEGAIPRDAEGQFSMARDTTSGLLCTFALWGGPLDCEYWSTGDVPGETKKKNPGTGFNVPGPAASVPCAVLGSIRNRQRQPGNSIQLPLSAAGRVRSIRQSRTSKHLQHRRKITSDNPIEALSVLVSERDQVRLVAGVERVYHGFNLGGRQTKCRPDQAQSPPNGIPIDRRNYSRFHHVAQPSARTEMSTGDAMA
jgi:hypothetical protein